MRKLQDGVLRTQRTRTDNIHGVKVFCPGCGAKQPPFLVTGSMGGEHVDYSVGDVLPDEYVVNSPVPRIEGHTRCILCGLHISVRVRIHERTHKITGVLM